MEELWNCSTVAIEGKLWDLFQKYTQRMDYICVYIGIDLENNKKFISELITHFPWSCNGVAYIGKQNLK